MPRHFTTANDLPSNWPASSRKSATSPAGPAFEIVTEPDRLVGLRAEWDDLWARADTPRLSQSFAWCLAGWRTTGAPRGRRLCVVVLRVDRRTVVIWPMTRRRCVAWRIGGPLGPEGTEYDPVLVEAGPDAERHLRATLTFVRRHCAVDILSVPYIRHGTTMDRLLAAEDGDRVMHTQPCLFTRWDGIASWDAYWRSRDRGVRNEVMRRGRRLAEQGCVIIETIDDPAGLRHLVGWTLDAKCDWLARRRIVNRFLPTPEFRAFLLSVCDAPAHGGRLIGFALRLDGRLVATQIAALSDTCCEAMIAVYDPAFSAHGPGRIILAEVLRWCQARGLTYDFRIGDEPYKYAWANGDCPATAVRLAITRWGRVLLAIRAARWRWHGLAHGLRTRTHAAWRDGRHPLRPRAGHAQMVPSPATGTRPAP